MKVAKRYAKALFDSLAPERYVPMRSLLNSFSELFLKSTDMTLALNSPSYPLAQREAALTTLASEVSGGDKNFIGLLLLLLRNKRLNLIEDVAKSFSLFVDQYQRLIKLTIETAVPISEDEKKQALDQIRRSLGSTAEVSWKVDEALLGGARIIAGDVVLDNSIDKALREIERVLRT
jgi:F-type H+-transporting ATPase subunit delta